MSSIPAKYRFFLTVPSVGEREIFPLYDPGQISFTYEKYNEFTNDFKIIANDNIILYDNLKKQNTATELNRPYQFLQTNSNTLVQSFDISVRKYENGYYKTLVFTKMKIMDNNLNQYIDSQSKFVGKLETVSKHTELEAIWNAEVNILETNISYKKTATLVSEAINYDNCFELNGVISHILTEYNIGITLASDPFPFISDTVLIDKLLIADKTDIKRPNATSNATVNNVSFLQILKWMQSKFNLKYRISATNELYFEHESERDQAGISIADSQILNYNQRGYGFAEYEKTITIGDFEGKTAGFTRQLIEFPVTDGTSKEYIGDNMNNDLQFIIDNQSAIVADPDSKDEVGDTGVTLIGCDSSYNIYEGSGVYNARLQNSYLAEKCFYYDLYFEDFTQNGSTKSIISYRKQKKTEIKIKNIPNFDASINLITSFGTCEIEKADLKGDNLTLTLLYQ